MRRLIPQPVIAVVAEFVSSSETHASLDSLFLYAGCPGDPPEGSKHVKALEWLRRTNRSEDADPLEALGRLVEQYMDRPTVGHEEYLVAFRSRLTETLARSGLQYTFGGTVTGGLGPATKSLEHYIRSRDLRSVSEEFERATKKAESEPREAASAAANILESICKHYIEDRALPMPAKQVLGELWAVVRKDLGFDPSQVADDDLRSVLSGLIQVVQGLAAFRTHASSAHGSGPRSYRIQPRHSRLVVHAAHSVALFILESWERRALDGRDATST